MMSRHSRLLPPFWQKTFLTDKVSCCGLVTIDTAKVFSASILGDACFGPNDSGIWGPASLIKTFLVRTAHYMEQGPNETRTSALFQEHTQKENILTVSQLGRLAAARITRITVKRLNANQVPFGPTDRDETAL